MIALAVAFIFLLIWIGVVLAAAQFCAYCTVDQEIPIFIAGPLYVGIAILSGGGLFALFDWLFN